MFFIITSYDWERDNDIWLNHNKWKPNKHLRKRTTPKMKNRRRQTRTLSWVSTLRSTSLHTNSYSKAQLEPSLFNSPGTVALSRSITSCMSAEDGLKNKLSQPSSHLLVTFRGPIWLLCLIQDITFPWVEFLHFYSLQEDTTCILFLSLNFTRWSETSGTHFLRLLNTTMQRALISFPLWEPSISTFLFLPQAQESSASISVLERSGKHSLSQ